MKGAFLFTLNLFFCAFSTNAMDNKVKAGLRRARQNQSQLRGQDLNASALKGMNVLGKKGSMIDPERSANIGRKLRAALQNTPHKRKGTTNGGKKKRNLKGKMGMMKKNGRGNDAGKRDHQIHQSSYSYYEDPYHYSDQQYSAQRYNDGQQYSAQRYNDDGYYYGQDYDDGYYVYYSSSSKGKGKKKSKSSKYYYYYSSDSSSSEDDTSPPTDPPVSSPDDDEFLGFLDNLDFDEEFFEDEDDCELITFFEEFSFEVSGTFVGPLGDNSTGDEVGTLFVLEPVFLQESGLGDDIDTTLVTGTCTRTVENEADFPGAGVCQLTFLAADGDYSLSLSGLLDSFGGGSLAITGGTGNLISSIGEFLVTPIFTDGGNEDIFTGVDGYDVEAYFGIIVCPPNDDLNRRNLKEEK